MTFLQHIAGEILRHPRPEELTVVFPNKRPSLFLARELTRQAGRPVLMPRTQSINEFLEARTPYTVAPRFDLLLSLYEVYRQLADEHRFTPQTLEQFLGWAPMLLNDFDEVDKFLVDPLPLFGELGQIKSIEAWGENLTEGSAADDYLRFYRSLPDLYRAFTGHLARQGLATQGMVYRHAARHVEQWLASVQTGQILLAGFNALTKAEETVFSRIIALNKGRIYWQGHATYLQPPYEAGRFINRYRRHPVLGPTIPDFTADISPRSRHVVVRAEGDQSQVDFVRDRLAHLPDGTDWLRTAVVVNDTRLIVPLLYQIPPGVPHVNITAGFPLTQAGSLQWLGSLVRWHTERERGLPVDWQMLNRWLSLDITRRLAPAQTEQLLAYSRQSPLRYGDYRAFCQMLEDERLRTLLCPPANLESFLETVGQTLPFIIQNATDEFEKNIWRHADAFWQKLSEYHRRFGWFDSFHAFEKIFLRLLHQEHIPFEGHPLQGLQIMGLLETRLLEFDRVFFLSTNEGVIPPAHHTESFIPADVRRAYGLPLHDEKNAVMAYHFYRLAASAKEVYYVYNASQDAWQGNEPSRFVRQMQYKWPAKGIRFEQLQVSSRLQPEQPPKIFRKDAAALTRLEEYARQRGFSPSAILSYWYHPEDFYRQYILQWRDETTPQASIAANDLGTVIHESLQQLYTPHLNRPLSPAVMKQLLAEAGPLTREIFKREYARLAGNSPLVGKNLLALEASVEMVRKLLEIDRQLVEKGHEVVIRRLESELSTSMDFPGKGPLKFHGKIDRVDTLDGTWRIVDYKTGGAKLPAKMPPIDSFATNPERRYQFQLWFYSWLVHRNEPAVPGLPLQNLIYTPRSQQSVRYGLPYDETAAAMLENLIREAVEEILDPDIPVRVPES